MSWTRKKRFLAAAIVACAGAAYFSQRSEPAAGASLGTQWQCSRTAWILTSCTKAGHTESALQGSRNNPMCRRLRDGTARV
jgi:hypothetical protein